MTDPTTAELLPCPFCGKPAAAHFDDEFEVHWIGCSSCNGRNSHPDEAEAIAAWNSRPPADEVQIRAILTKHFSGIPWDSPYRARFTPAAKEIAALQSPIQSVGLPASASVRAADHEARTRALAFQRRHILCECLGPNARTARAALERGSNMGAGSCSVPQALDAMERYGEFVIAANEKWRIAALLPEQPAPPNEAALREYAREASKALTYLVGGGSEMFKRLGDEFYADPELCKRRGDEKMAMLARLGEHRAARSPTSQDGGLPDGEAVERLGEALHFLSDKLRSSGFLDRDEHHAAYERVVVEFRAVSPTNQPIKADEGEA